MNTHAITCRNMAPVTSGSVAPPSYSRAACWASGDDIVCRCNTKPPVCPSSACIPFPEILASHGAFPRQTLQKTVLNMPVPGCPEPVWGDGHFSTCFRHVYLGILFPISGCLVSLALILVPILRRSFSRNAKPAGFEPVATTDDPDPGFTDPSPQVTECPPLYVPAPGHLVSVCEGLIIAIGVWYSIDNILHQDREKAAPLVLWVPVAVSCYLLLLLASRQWISHKKNHNLAPTIWKYCAWLYLFQWTCNILALQLAVVTLTEWPLLSIIFQSAVFTTLVAVVATTPRIPVDCTGPEDVPGDSVPRASKEQPASILSHLTFYWVGDIVWTAFRRPLEASDLCDLNHEDKSTHVTASFRVTAATAFSLLSRFRHFFRRDLLEQGAWAAGMSLTIYIPAMLLRFIIEYLQSPDRMASSTAWMCVAGLLVFGVMTGVAECRCEWIGRKIGIKLRAILISEVYGKLLRRRLAATVDGETMDTGDGNILNLMAVDAEKVSEVAAYMHLLWISVPVQLIVATCMLYSILGISGVVGLVLMIVMLPLNVWIAQQQGEVQGRLLTAMDARVQSTSEAMANIRTIKYCAWEDGFNDRITQLRRTELRRLRLRFIWWSLGMTVWYSIPFVITTITLLLYTVVGKGTLESSIAFPALAVFQALRLPLDRVADMISFVLQAFVSLKRIERFLAEPETRKYSQLSSRQFSPKVGFDDATFNWSVGGSVPSDNHLDGFALADTTAPPFRLQNLQMEFKQGALNIICGPSGSGKSSLLLALLGEMNLLHGQVLFPPNVNVAYCPQEPWIVNESIRENIIFGLPFDIQRYATVTRAVALPHDFVTLDHGDQSLAGESGSRLSGGQKQRVGLARALYSRASFVLLDDCLSAVDTATARHIFLQAIQGPIMEGRTCIFATHHTQLVFSHAEFVVFLENGRVRCQGTPRDLVPRGLVSADLVDEVGVEDEIPDDIEKAPRSEDRNVDIAGESESFDGGNGSQEEPPRHEEEKATGAMSLRVVKTYAGSMGGPLFWVLVLAAFSAQQVASLGSNLWIKKWAHEYDELLGSSSMPKSHSDPETASPTDSKQVNAGYHLAVYAAMCLVFVAITFVRDIAIFYGALKASSNIHQRLLQNVLHAKLAFFDSTPLGQITNRFSKDVEAVDQELAPYSTNTIYMLATITMTVLFISVVLPAFLILAVIICLIYYCIGAVYISSSRDLKRIESVQRSPLHQHFGETLRGYVSIRAYGCMPSFVAKAHNLIDGYNRPSLLLWAGKEWLTLRTSSASAIISSLTGVFVLWKMGSISPGSAGLVLTYSTTFSENMLWFVQLYAIIQQNFNSVERIIGYTDVDQEEPGPIVPMPTGLPQYWPATGIVQFEGYTARYATQLDPALHNITFEVPAGSRVAIVGRTGAGKSTIALALIRGIHASEGRILLDGIDIAAVPLRLLREVISVVPQDPILFTGSWRRNLDPTSRFADTELRAALRAVGLPVPDSVNGLDAPVEGLSLGQRQLLCIARALVRRARVLILDEATASVDHHTDAMVQPVLRDGSGVLPAGTTVITIAHRLRPVADYDKIIVLDSGRVVEQGSVSELLEQRGQGAVFRRLCRESGDLETIERMARARR